MWFRRDLRLADNPALLSAASDATDARVVPLFVLDPALWRPAGPARRAYLAASLTDLGNRVGGLVLRRGEPVEEVVAVARAARATAVHIAEDFGPYGRQRDHDVEAALARHDIVLVRTGSPYAVAPGRVVNKNRDAYRMFTPYSRTWREHGWPAPPMPPRRVSWMRPLKSDDLDDAPTPGNLRLPAAGEWAAHRRWREFIEQRLDSYGTTRDRADLDSTSRMSAHLKWGEIHPRTLLADLGRQRSEGAATYRTELAWQADPQEELIAAGTGVDACVANVPPTWQSQRALSGRGVRRCRAGTRPRCCRGRGGRRRPGRGRRRATRCW